MGSPAAHDDDDRRAAHRALVVSAVGLGLTAGVELVLAALTGSVALLGDGLHNLADVSSSALVFVGLCVSKRQATSRFPYGYERAEDLAGLAIALIIWCSAVLAGVESGRKLVAGAAPTHLGWGMAGALLGIAGNLVVARYKLTAGRWIRSATLMADARHSGLDALSSAGALAGLAGVSLGLRRADAVAGLVVTAFICRVGWVVTRELGARLMDAVDPLLLERTRTAALRVPGVLEAEARGRWTGRTLHLEVALELVPTATLAEAAHTGEAVRAGIRAAVEEARSIHVCALPRRGSCTRGARSA